MDNQIIKPGIGIGIIVLGSTEETVRSLLGSPTDAQISTYAIDDISLELEYDALMVTLVFSEYDSFRLDTISTSDEKSIFNGTNIVGMTESQLVRSEFNGVGPPQLDEDFEESGKEYYWNSLNMSCWLTNGFVTSVTIMPNFDESGDIPIWPSDQS